MKGFALKKIPPKQSLGEKLRKIRESNFYTTKRLAKNLLIHEKYVKAIENNCYENLPDKMSTKNFIGSYAKFFKKDPSPYLNQYFEETKKNGITPITPIKTRIQKPVNNGFKFWATSNLAKNLLIAFLILAFISYIGLEIKKIITAPELILSAPQDEQIVKMPIIKVVGKTEKEAKLKINGEIVMPHSDGSFDVELDLQKGLNLIKISAAKKYSKENIIYRKIIFEEAVVLR